MSDLASNSKKPLVSCAYSCNLILDPGDELNVCANIMDCDICVNMWMSIRIDMCTHGYGHEVMHACTHRPRQMLRTYVYIVVNIHVNYRGSIIACE